MSQHFIKGEPMLCGKSWVFFLVENKVLHLNLCAAIHFMGR